MQYSIVLPARSGFSLQCRVSSAVLLLLVSLPSSSMPAAAPIERRTQIDCGNGLKIRISECKTWSLTVIKPATITADQIKAQSHESRRLYDLLGIRSLDYLLAPFVQTTTMAAA